MTTKITDTKHIDAIFFDMEGTLWDGVESYAQGFKYFFKAQNIDKRFTKHNPYGNESNFYLYILNEGKIFVSLPSLFERE